MARARGVLVKQVGGVSIVEVHVHVLYMHVPVDIVYQCIIRHVHVYIVYFC